MYEQIRKAVLNIIPVSGMNAKYIYIGFIIFVIMGLIASNSSDKKYFPLLATVFICLIIKVLDAVFLNHSGFDFLMSLVNMLLIPTVISFVCKRRA